ncbi:MAG: uroporphyrinogen decarboxylase family protein, partial [Anaerolineaceae bacterium]|nr:uroporphyrinogen decarboxylase family protein [Anaerolineaceae bacterium]
VLETVKDLWLNIAHIHGEDIMFNQVADYPVQIINWHDRHTAPSLSEAQTQFAGAVCGGLRRWETMAVGDPQTIRAEACQAINQTGGRRFILGTGCVMPIITPHTNILAARHSVD